MSADQVSFFILVIGAVSCDREGTGYPLFLGAALIVFCKLVFLGGT